MSDNESSSGWVNISYFLILAVLLAFGILQFSGTLVQNERPVVSVVSCSMYPVYDKGDVLIVKGTDFEDIKEDDIVVFSAPLKIEAEIDEKTYEISKDSVETPLGSMKVVAINNNNGGILSINGKKTRVWEGTSINVNGERIRIREISGVNIPVVHRVIDKRDDSLETKGDNNENQLEFEKDIKPEQVYGKVQFKIPKIGLVKILGMDFLGLRGAPLRFDSYQSCSR